MAQNGAITKETLRDHSKSRSDHADKNSSFTSPNPASIANLFNRSSSCFKHETIDSEDDDREPSSDLQRRKSLITSESKSDKEKRKRSRVTPEQLIHLERCFIMDRSPTAARRRDISDLLGMQERQTQIWFQNRRAKAKLQDSKLTGRRNSTEAPPDTPSELTNGFEVDLHSLLNEAEPITIIFCTDLLVGSWRRTATSETHDLVAYVSDSKGSLTWFIRSGGCGFKMNIPFDTVVDTDFSNAATPGSGMAVFVLSRPPVFYLENVSCPFNDGSVIRTWKRCSDWTEGHQATQVLRHTLVGSAVQLAQVLQKLRVVPVKPATYRPQSFHFPMEMPSSANLVYARVGHWKMPSQPNCIEPSREHPSYGAGYVAEADFPPPPHSAPSATPAQRAYLSHCRLLNSSSPELMAYHDYHHSHKDSSISVESVVPQNATNSAENQIYYSTGCSAFHIDYQPDFRHFNVSRPLTYDIPPPSLINTPYLPALNIQGQPTNYQPPSLEISTIHGIVYDIEQDLRAG